MKELINIQKELKAPKGQYNSFGKYKYRSAEDILEAVKPLLDKYGCQLTLADDIVLIGDRYYVKAIATIRSDKQVEYTTAYAREDLDKKGMDGSQITGTASSYARKYALNGLFLIDDTKDADTDEYANQQNSKSDKPTTASKKETAVESKEEPAVDTRKETRDKMLKLGKELGYTATDLAKMYGLTRDTSTERFQEIILGLNLEKTERDGI